MANFVSQVKLPNNTTYIIRDPNARPLSNNDFDTINVTELNAGDLIVTGVGRFTNGLYGNLTGNADTASSATKATQDESGNNIKDTYANSFSISDHTITLKNKNGTSLGTVTVPDNNTTYTIGTGTANGKIKVTPSSGSAYEVSVYGLKSAAYKDVTDTYSATGTDPVSGKAVAAAIDALPEPMVFKGSLGTGGTITALPTNGTAKVGDTYKVITAGTYASKAAKVGDTFICLTKTSSANTWELIPSGDEPSGTVTSVAVSNGGGLSVSGSPITTSGTITISHADTSSQASVNNSGRTYIQDITLDTYGHVTGIASATETVVNTDRYVNSAAFADATSADANNPLKMTLTRAGSDTASVTAYLPKISSSSAGIVPKGTAVSSQSQSTKFLREDGTWAAPTYTVNTDTKVTAVGNHYTPAENAGSQLDADASSTTAATWDSTSLVTGVTIKRDAKGHVTGLAVDSIKMPANPNTNTTYTFAEGSTNGAFSVTPSGGSAQSVPIHGLKSAAYTESSAYATSGHTHSTSIASSTDTSEITLAHGGVYTLTAGGTSFVFKMPSSGNTDTKVRQALVTDTDNTNRPLLLAYSNTSTTTSNVDNISYRVNTIYANASTGTITATKFVGTLDGNATTATNASKVNNLTVETAVPANAKFTDTNYYHTTGSWSGLTYTATANGGAGALAFTIPTGTSATTVAVGNHTHSYAGSSSVGGDATRALKLKDKTNNIDTYLDYGSSAVTWGNITYIGAWDGYTLRAMNKNQITPANIGAAAVSHNQSADTITSGYLNIQPENSPILIPFMNNDLAYMITRGGSTIVKYDGTTQSVDISGCFDAGPGYGYGISNSGDYTTIVMELTLHQTFTWTNTIYVDFGSSGWRAKDVEIEVMNTNYSGDTWTSKYHNTSNASGHCYVITSHKPSGASNTGGGFNKIRFTFQSFNSSIFRIAQLGVYNYGSAGLRTTYMSRGIDDAVWRNISPATTNTYNLGSASLKWADAYATTFHGALDGNAATATLLNQDTTYKEGTAYVCQTSAGTVKAFCSRANNSNIGVSTNSYGCMLLSATWGGGTSYNGELFIGMGDFPNLYFRGKNNGTYTSWKAIGQFTATPTSGQVVITDGATGGMKSSGYTIAKSVPSNAVFTDTDTKNTAGSTDTSSKIYLVGATSQAANPQTYSDNELYTTSGVLTTKSVQVGGGSATIQYNTTTNSIDFVFAN